MMVVPILIAMFDAQNESRLRKWLDECYIGVQKLVIKVELGLCFEVYCAHL